MIRTELRSEQHTDELRARRVSEASVTTDLHAERAKRAAVDAPAAPGSLIPRLLTALILAVAVITLVLAVPPLRGVARQIGRINVGWIAVAVGLEVASCAAFVVVFRLFFHDVPAGLARELAWTEEASGALLPTGGVGALAIGGILLRQAGMSTSRVVERSSALFFLTSAVNVAALALAGALFASGALGGSGGLLLGLIPVVMGVGAILAALALPAWLRRSSGRAMPAWLRDVVAGVGGARHALVRPNWRLLGAFGYLGFDIAALGAAFAATGHSISLPALVAGYLLGYMANMLPIPGGFGVLEAGLAGTLIAYGAPAAPAAAAVVVYHAIAFWIPSLGGLAGYARLRRRQGAWARSEEPAWARSEEPRTVSPGLRIVEPAAAQAAA
jgi:uncharacterized membrane protein YbhN (UPF0104 family)